MKPMASREQKSSKPEGHVDLLSPRWFFRARSRATRWHEGHAMTLLETGDEFFPALCAAIDAASTSIHFETYIFRLDETGLRVLEHLLQAAARKVRVRVVIDGFGSAEHAGIICSRLKAGGAQCRIYQPEPALWLRYLPLPLSRLRRLHRKIISVDGRLAFIGGINVENDWVGQAAGGDGGVHWLDYAVQVEGPVVQEVVSAQESVWLQMNHPRFFQRFRYWVSPRCNRQVRGSSPLLVTSLRMAFLIRDNLRHRHTIEAAYLTAIKAARVEILLANAYFLPGRRIRRALINAAQRGVRVQLLLQGRIEYPLQHRATRWLYQQFIQAGVEIYEYLPSYLHAKVAVVDRLAMVGSSNLDAFSLLLAREANLLIDDAEFSGRLRASLNKAIARGGRLIEPTPYALGNGSMRLADWGAYWLLRLGVVLTGQGRGY